VRRELWIYGVLGVLTLAVYWPVTRAEFINFDDPAYVTDNPPVMAGLTVGGLVWALTTGHCSNWHPLTWVSHMADCQWFGLDAGRHHLTSLLFHVVNTLLVFGWLRGLTGAVWRSALVATLFGWHPLHVESVAWISERKDVLSTFFGLLTLMAYGRYVQESKVQGPKPKIYYSLALGFYVLGLLSKPMLVTLPLVLLLLDWWPLNRIYDLRLTIGEPKKRGQHETPTALILEKVPFLLLAVGSSVVTFLVQRAGGAVISVGVIPVGERVANAVMSYARYLGKMVWPERLAMYYPAVKDWAGWQVAGALALLVGVTVWVVRERARRPYLAVGWLWYLGTLVPVIGLVQVGAQAMADRYTYIPLIGIFIMVAWGMGDLLAHRPGMKWLPWGLAVPVLAACLMLTEVQVSTWQTAITVCRHTLAVTTKNARIENLLGQALMKQNNVDEATFHFQKAIEYLPGYTDALDNLTGVAWVLATSPEASVRNGAKAVELAKQTEQASKDTNAIAIGTLAAAYAETGRFADATATAERALRVANSQDNATVADELRVELKSYQANQPIRDPSQASPGGPR
jgi:protein O-mannosyl-transferase